MNHFLRRLLGDAIPKRQYTLVYFNGLPGPDYGRSLEHQLGKVLSQAGHRGFVWPTRTHSNVDSWDTRDNHQSEAWLKQQAAGFETLPKTDALLLLCCGIESYNLAQIRLAALVKDPAVIALRYSDLHSEAEDLAMLGAGADFLADVPTKGTSPWITITQIESFLNQREG